MLLVGLDFMYPYVRSYGAYLCINSYLQMESDRLNRSCVCFVSAAVSSSSFGDQIHIWECLKGLSHDILSALYALFIFYDRYQFF